MKRCLLFFLVLPLFGFYILKDGGVKAGKTTGAKYLRHDPIKGFSALESKVNHKLKVAWSSFNSTPSIVWGGLTNPGYSVSADKAQDGIRFISENVELFGIKEPAKELKAISSVKDDLSTTHVKYQQYINGLEVFPCELIIHFDSDGSVESVNGTYIPTPVFNTMPELSPAAATEFAKSKLGSYQTIGEEAELMVYQLNGSLRLTYEVKLPSKSFPNMKVYVDAVKGELIKIDNGIRYDGPVRGSGIGLDGKVKTIDTYSDGGGYYLLDASLPMYIPPVDSFKGVIATYDAKNDTANNGYDKAILISDPNGDNNFNDNQGLRAAVSAHTYTKTVYNFYKSRFNRNSFDGKGKTITNVVHYKDKYNNAFWNGYVLSYGDGDGVEFSNLAGALDVITHEFTHAVTSSTADLVYEMQPGALNESISDAFASLIDSTNWLIGEDITTPAITGDGLRSMKDPHNGQSNGDLANGWLPAHMSEFVILENNEDNDWGGVHINSGIPNKAFYNVASVLGHYKTGRIWYRSLTAYLTKNSQFSDFRIACLKSAKDLYGETSTEYKTVADAFSAVGIEDQTTSIAELIYDDNTPDINIYETEANWQLAVKFTPPTKSSEIQDVKIYYGGDHYSGSGQFYLNIYEANSTTGLPGSARISPYFYTPSTIGWYKFTLSNCKVSNDFFVAIAYDGIGFPYIGGDNPPGNGKAYEYDPSKKIWYKLTSPDDYTLFMRATVKSITTDVEIDSRVPAAFQLEQNYPNPFNPTTIIKYSLPEETKVQLTVYDALGNRVAELVNSHQNPGTYTVSWNGRSESGSPVSSGIYYYKITAGNFTKTSKMMLIK